MTRTSKKKLNNRAKVLITVVIVAICLFVLHKFDFFTKSEITNSTGIKFIEYGTETEVDLELEYFQDENNNSYIILPESINGYYASTYRITAENPIALFNNSLIEDEQSQESNEEIFSSQTTIENVISNTDPSTNNSNINTDSNNTENTTVENNDSTNTYVENTITNTTTNTSNTNTVENLVENTLNTNTVENTIAETNTLTKDSTNTIKNSEDENSVSTLSLEDENDNNEVKTIDEQSEDSSETNTVSDNTTINSTNTVESTENTVSENVITENTNTVTNVSTESEAENNTENNIENVSKENTSENDSTTISDNSVENYSINNLSESDIMTAAITDAVYRPGEKIYLDAETIANDSATIEVTFDAKDVNGVKLYNREIEDSREVAATDESEGESYKVNIKGYIPKDYYLNIEKKSNADISKKIADVKEFKEAEILLGLDITITDGTNNYNPKDYQEYTIVTITSDTYLNGNLDNSSAQVLHFEETETEERIEKIVVTEKTANSVKFITDAFSEYSVIAYPAILPDSVTIDDYDSDYNYYMGKNYTDNLSGEYNATYTDSNLAKVNINYYSYNYNKSFNGNNDLEITDLTWAYQRYQDANTYRNYTIRLTINAPTNTTIDPDKSWVMSLTSPNANFSATQTKDLNADIFSTIAVDSANSVSTITITGKDLSGWTETTEGKTYTTDIILSFSNNANVNLNTVDNLNITVNEKVLIGYVSAADDERQVLFSYIKCVPIDGSGNVTLELIDNPYMDRPAGYGFNGWTTNESGYTITINNDTKLQKVTVSTGGVKEITINLYVNWAEANVIFVNGDTGNNNNDGKTVNTPVQNWTGISNKFTNANRKTITNASNREVNIIVLTGGTLTGLTTNINPGYTLTSLYDGVDYRYDAQGNINAELSFNNNYTLDAYDLQLDYLNIINSNNYTSTTTTDTINRYLIGNGRNVRIGRGMTPLTDTGTATTFAQIQGGPSSNTNINRSYRLVIESGKYANIHSGRTEGRTYTSSATLVFGCDYDRIKNNNTNLRVYNRSATRSGTGTITSKDSGEPVHKIIIKSGSLGMDAFNAKAGDYEFSGVYIGGHSAGTDNNDRIMIVEGGNVANLLGGLAIQSNTSTVRTYIYMKGGHVQYIVGGAGVSTTRGQRTIQVTGGSVAYSVAGGSNGVTAGTTNNSSNPTGQLDGNTLVYVGGNAVIGTELGNLLYDVEAGCVLGAGNGNDVLPDTAGKVNYSHVIIDGEAIVSNNVYGGGNYGMVGNNGAGLLDSEELMPEAVEYINYSTNFSTTEHYLIGTGASSGEFLSYNGSNFESGSYNTGSLPTGADDWILEDSGNGTYYLKSYSENKYVTLTPNYTRQTVTVRDGYFPWSPTTTVQNAIVAFNGFDITFSDMPQTEFEVQTSGNAVRIYYEHSYTIYTRGYGNYYTENNRNENNYISPSDNGCFTTDTTNVYLLKFQESVDDGNETEVTETADATSVIKIDILGGTVQQSVYGGANKNNILGSVDIYMEDGTVEGAIYGGSNDTGTIDGAAKITVKGGTLGKQTASTDVLFGGGKGSNTRIAQRTVLDITDEKKDLNVYGSIYGGSALGRVSASSTIDVKDLTTNTNKILINGNIFGGGRGDSTVAAVTGGKVTVNIDGGTYSNTSVFGGCNERGIILNSILVNIGQNYATRVANVYGGGNNAAIIASTNSDYVYLYKNATVEKAFNGGNNAGIQANNTITPRAIYAKGATVGELYGGSNNTGNLTQSFVYVSEGATITNVYGGGYGEGAQITGMTTVEIKDSTVEENVYGGGNAGAVGASTDVDISTSTIGNVYAGGKGTTAVVTTGTDLYITGSTVIGNVYGGGNNGPVGVESDATNNANTLINMTDTVVGDSVYAAGEGVTAIVTGNTVANLTDSEIIGNVYGGGNNGSVGIDTALNITSTDVGQSVYAGGKGATAVVKGDTVSNIKTSNIAQSIYGGGNAGPVGNATTQETEDDEGNTIITVTAITDGTTDVNIEGSTIGDSVYGGGKSAYIAYSNVDIDNSTITNNIYGGGEEGEVVSHNNNISTAIYLDYSSAGNVFGGGKGKAASVAASTVIDMIDTTVHKNSTDQGNVYGGGDLGHVSGDTSITITTSDIKDTIFGGGNSADIDGCTSVAVVESNVDGNVYGGGNAGKVSGTGNVGTADASSSTAVSIEGSTVKESVFGGGNAGQVIGNTYLLVTHLIKEDSSIALSTINGNAYGGGNQANVGGTTVSILNDTTITSVYGGGNLGEVEDSTSVIIDNSNILNNAFGGGSGSVTDTTGVKGQVVGDTTLNVRNQTEVQNEIFGGGDNGRVQGSSSVYVSSSIIGGNAYAAGNGTAAKVLKNSYILAEGTTQIGKSIFGGGNAAETGEAIIAADGTKTYEALAIVDIAGAVIGKNVYGGANSSVINGDTITNIGIQAINDYHGEDKGFEMGKIDIGGTIFGGGESMDPNKEFSYTDISVEGTILINLDGEGYDTDDTNTIYFAESIFGSGNASSAAVNGNVNIRNYGTRETPKKGISIQRSGTVIIDNSSLQLRGTTDSTSPLNPDGVFTFNIIDAIKSTNNSTLYLENGANLVGGYYSINGEVTDNPEYATVKIIDTVYGEDGNTYESINGKIYDDDGNEKYYISAGVIYEPSKDVAEEDTVITNITSVEYASTIERNVDNRVYAYTGRNINISESEDVLSLFGDVKGMSFFGIFNLDGTVEDDTESNIYMGMYDPEYTVGQDLTWAERDFNRTYVLGIHYNDHDITKDGFYTVYEKLRVELDVDEVLTEENYQNYNPYSYTSYITPTPKEDAYYMWCAGPDEEVYYYSMTLVGSKYSSFGTKELALIGISAENAVLTMSSFESALVDGVGLYDKNTIPNINTDKEAANNMFGLTMKTGNTGWSMSGQTDFYADAITEDNQERNSTYEGTTQYVIENLKTTPIFSFYLYHSNNITEERELGTCQVNMKLSYWKDSLNRGTGTIIIDVILMSEVYDNIGYNGAITPGSQYDLFTNTVTNVTTKSSFSVYFEFAQEDFSTIEHVQKYYDQSYRVITTGYAFPEGTTITMIDRWNRNNPEYYYYIVTKDDFDKGKTEYRFTEFLAMGSSDEPYDEVAAREKYLIEDMDYQYENFIFIVNFENAKFTDIKEDTSLITNNQEFNIYLNADYDGSTNALYYLLDEQMGSIIYGIYNTESTIEVEADLSKNRIFLGNDVTLNVDTIYNVAKGEQGALVYDTRYFDKKLGVKLTMYKKIDDTDNDDSNDVYEVVSGGSLLGAYFELNNVKYYPRADGTTRIKIAELVSNASSSIKVGTENSSLPTGEYRILIESFGSPDGIYYGIEASDSTWVNLEIINDLFGLNSTLPPEQVIIDKDTGYTLGSDGTMADGANKLEFDLEYVSGLNNPYITVSLYRRNYDETMTNPYENTYTLVDLSEYVSDTLELPVEINQTYDDDDLEFIESIKQFENEYTAIDTTTLKETVNTVTGNDNTIPITLNFDYNLKQKLTTGTYKVEFKLYDATDSIAYKQETNDKGEVSQEAFKVTEYTYIGETFSYIIIK